MNQYFIITIDVEDWFQVENFKKWIAFDSWKDCELRVEKNTHQLLDLFDSILCPQTIHATFFILGWVAEKLPHLVKEIYRRGHEVASHGYNHNLCTDEDPEKLNDDLVKSKILLENITGDDIVGYRAPSFSINNNVLTTLRETGYIYDSSYNSFAMNPRYGRMNFTNHRQDGIALEIFDSFYELPISNLQIGSKVLPFGGGGFFRLFPLVIYKMGIYRILKQKNAYLFYMHPWEIDPHQPKVIQASRLVKFRHYVNLISTHEKLSNLIKSHKECEYVTCREYIDRINNTGTK